MSAERHNPHAGSADGLIECKDVTVASSINIQPQGVWLQFLERRAASIGVNSVVAR